MSIRLLLALCACGAPACNTPSEAPSSRLHDDAGARAGVCFGRGTTCDDVEVLPFALEPERPCTIGAAGVASVVWRIETDSAPCETSTCGFEYRDIATAADGAWVAAAVAPHGFDPWEGLASGSLLGVVLGEGSGVNWATVQPRPRLAGPEPSVRGMRAFDDGLVRLAPRGGIPGLELHRCDDATTCVPFATVVDKATLGAAAFDREGGAAVVYAYEDDAAGARGSRSYPPPEGPQSIGIARLGPDGALLYHQTALSNLLTGPVTSLDVAITDDGHRVFVLMQQFVAALDGDGNVAWVRDFERPATSVVQTESGVAVHSDNSIHQLDHDGANLRRVTFPWGSPSGLAVRPSGGLLIFDASTGGLFETAPDGTLCTRWHVPLDTLQTLDNGQTVSGNPCLAVRPDGDVAIAVSTTVAMLHLGDDP